MLHFSIIEYSIVSSSVLRRRRAHLTEFDTAREDTVQYLAFFFRGCPYFYFLLQDWSTCENVGMALHWQLY